MHHLTENLLGLIEENATWKVAFGFNKGEVKSVKNGGKKIVDHYQTLATKLFLADPSGRWDKTSDIKKLGNVVKNRINA
jgi:hypothetical protein